MYVPSAAEAQHERPHSPSACCNERPQAQDPPEPQGHGEKYAAPYACATQHSLHLPVANDRVFLNMQSLRHASHTSHQFDDSLDERVLLSVFEGAHLFCRLCCSITQDWLLLCEASLAAFTTYSVRAVFQLIACPFLVRLPAVCLDGYDDALQS
jgi:hypothetical protein